MQLHLILIQPTGGRLGSQPKSLSSKTLILFVVIHIQDHLDGISDTSHGDEIENIQSNDGSNCEIITFPTDPHNEVSNEEIGKWVDRLMQMPELEGDFQEPLDQFSEEFDDPFIQVAERVLSEDSI